MDIYHIEGYFYKINQRGKAVSCVAGAILNPEIPELTKCSSWPNAKTALSPSRINCSKLPARQLKARLLETNHSFFNACGQFDFQISSL